VNATGIELTCQTEKVTQLVESPGETYITKPKS
jgi:hypothetical protein